MRRAIVVAALAAFAAAAGARAAEPMKIGYVDVQQIAGRSRSIQESVKSAEGEIKAKQEEIEIQIREYTKGRDDLKARRSVLSPDEAEKQEKKLDDLRDKIDAMRLEIDKRMRRTETDVMSPAVDRILAAVREIGKKQGFDMILSSDVVIYGNEKINLTPLVVEQLDSGMPAAEEKKEGEKKPEEKGDKKGEEKKAEEKKPEEKKTETKKGKGK